MGQTHWAKLARIALAGLFLLAGCGFTASAKKPLSQIPIADHRLQVIGFYATGVHTDLSAVYKYPKAIGDFAPFWYSVEASGNLKSHVDPSVLAKIRAAHIPITPLVNDGTGKQTFLQSPSTLLSAARNIADMVGSMKFQGVSIDFEPPVNALNAQLTTFITDLRDFLPHKDIIQMSIVPMSGGAYNFAKLNPEVTQYILMAYDEHDDGSKAGPIAATGWVQNLVNRMKKTVPGNKIILGVALYGYVWPMGSTHATTIPYSAITPVMAKHAKWSSRYQETYANFTTASGPQVAWWESLEGINEKLQIARRDKLAGVALWRLGYQTNAVMQTLLHQIGPQR